MKGLQRVGKIETCDLAYWYKNLDVVLLARIDSSTIFFLMYTCFLGDQSIICIFQYGVEFCWDHKHWPHKNSEMKVLMNVTTEEAGAVIGKNGLGIEAVREMSKARVEVSKKKENGENRVIRIEGEERRVAFAKHLIKMKIDAHKESLADDSDQGNLDDCDDPDLKVAASVLARIGNIWFWLVKQ